MRLECRHTSIAIGETFTRCLQCLSWRFTIGARWWPEHYELPWMPDSAVGEVEFYQVMGVAIPDLTVGGINQ